MPSRYFYGPSVKSNRVRASTARNFRSLVQQHLEGAIRLHHTQEQYAALATKQEKLDAKDTTYLLATTYGEDESARNMEHANKVCNLIFLDLDEENGICPAAPFTRSPDLLDKKLEGFNFAAYTTASSTTAKPRMRLVVDADAIPVSLYPQAVRTVAAMLSVSDYDKRSEVPNQPMICPTLFADQDEDMDHPIIRTSFKGRSFTAEDIRETTVEGKRTIAGPIEQVDGDDDGLEYLRAPLGGVTLEQVKEALTHLNPDMPYPEWFDVAAALRHQFSHTQAEEAFELFDTWSAQAGHRYPGQDGKNGTIEQWNAVKATPRGRVPITLRTLIKRASDAGWNPAPVKDACFNSVMDYIAQSRSRHDLTVTALEKIAGLPMLSSSDENTLLNAITKHLWDVAQEKVSLTALSKDLKRITSAKERSREEVETVEEKPCFKGWCYVTSDEIFFRPSSHQRMTGEAINAAYGRYLLPSEEQLERAGKEVNEGSLNTPLFEPKNYLLHHKQCLVVDGFDYDPANPKAIYTEDDNGVRLVNTYRKSYPKPDPKKAEKAGKVITDHLTNLIAEEEYRRTLMDYLAYNVQFPGRKIRWCPLIQGAEGCGKTLMARLLEATLGEDNVTLVNNDGIRSQWNDWAFGSQVIVIPEVYVNGKLKSETMNRLKDLLTDDRISVNQRNKSMRTVRNVANYLMFTNHHDALSLMAGSRRYFIIKSPLQTEDQVKALGEGYFEKLFATIRVEAPGLRSFFESWDISNDFPADGRAPKTIYLEEMIDDAAGDEATVLRRVIREGATPLVQYDLVDTVELKSHLDFDRVRHSDRSVAVMLRSENFQPLKGRGTLIGDTRRHLWVRAGCLRGVDVAEIAKQRVENNYTVTEEDWV